MIWALADVLSAYFLYTWARDISRWLDSIIEGIGDEDLRYPDHASYYGPSC
jgi:hypothetical protein